MQPPPGADQPGAALAWAGSAPPTVTARDQITAGPLLALAAALDHPPPEPRPGDPLPALAHWLYFLPHHRASELGPDGHARRGGFLPPVTLPRRMWAGGDVELLRPLRLGEAVEQRSRVVEVTEKRGRSGPLVFVRVRHEVSGADGLAIVEQQELVYRDRPRPELEAQAPARHRPAPLGAGFERRVDPDPVLLFRFSALTGNAHRIHYDRRYCLEEEGYPGLVVHGPLLATLLVDLVARHLPAATITRFSFRALSPLFDGHPVLLRGAAAAGGLRLWAEGEGGTLAMDASAELA